MDKITNHLHWSEKEKNFIKENVGVLPLAQMAKAVHRSEMAVRLFILRNKWTAKKTLSNNSLIRLLKVKFNHIEDFQPSRTFYRETKISQKKFWKIYRGEIKITQEEYLSVARYFGIPPQECFDGLQLELFEDDK